MPDITMCSPDKIRKLCEKCYRFTAKPSTWQSYSRFSSDYNQENDTCKHFIQSR